MGTLKLVKQKLKADCGIACVAMVSGYSYEKVKADFSKMFNVKTYRSSAAQLHRLLESYNKNVSTKISQAWCDISGVCIVGVNWFESNKFHWVVSVKDNYRFLIIDPETAQVYQGVDWIDVEDGFIHSPEDSNYLVIEDEYKCIEI